MCKSSENTSPKENQATTPTQCLCEKQYLDRIANLEHRLNASQALVDIQEAQKAVLKNRIAALQDEVRELLSR